MTNHLGNVLAVVSDRKLAKAVSGTAIQWFEADVLSSQQYYAFGMLMPGRQYSAAGYDYRFGFNGKEGDDEIKGDDNQQDYGMRIYDPRVGRFLSVDPIAGEYPWYTPYQFAGNMPIWAVDLDGLEPSKPPVFDGQIAKGQLGDNGPANFYARNGSWELTPLLSEVTIKARGNPVGFGKFAYSDSDWDDYSVASDFSKRDLKIAANAVINVLNDGLHLLQTNPVQRNVEDIKQIGGFLEYYGGTTPVQKVLDFTLSAQKFFGNITNPETAPEVADQVLGAGLQFSTGMASTPGLAAKTSTNIKYLGRMEDLKGIPRSQTILDELPNLGSAKANYYQNMSVIRRNLREGVTFKDASWFRPNSELAPTLLNPNRTVGQTFFGAERNLMQNRGLWPR